jgi:hypothetical protein
MRQIETNSGTESSGKPALGLELEQFSVIVIGAAAAGFYLAIRSNLGEATENDVVIAAALFIVPIIWIFALVRNRPPHFQRDFILSALGMGKWNAAPRRPKYDPVILGVIEDERRRNGT